MQKDHSTTGALSPTGLRSGGGFINKEVRAQSCYSSLSNDGKQQFDAEFKDYAAKGGKLNFWEWIAQEKIG